MVLVMVTVTGNLGLEQYVIKAEAAEETTTIYFVDTTEGQWTGNDNAIIELVDNTYGHDRYKMSTKDKVVWSAEVPKSTYNVTFNRYDSSGTTQWNSWSAGGRDGNNAYYVLGHEYGYWGNYSQQEGFHVGDKIYLDFYEFEEWRYSNAQYFINFTGASKEENGGKDINLDFVDRKSYSPILLVEEIEEDVFTYTVTEEEEGKTELRFWRGDNSILWNCSVVLSYKDYKAGNNCVKVQGWNNKGYVCPYIPRKQKTKIESMDLKIKGNKKENRKIVLDLVITGETDKLIKEDTKIFIAKLGEEENSGKKESEYYACDESSAGWNHRELIFREEGTYKILATVTDGKEEFTAETTVNIAPDMKPVADFKLNEESRNYIRNKNGIAQICITDCSVAEVGDTIIQRIYELYYDANNDGIFQDTELVDKKEGNELRHVLNLKSVGNYKIKLTVKERFEDTIESLIDDSAYLSGSTEDKSEEINEFTITNQTPSSSMRVEKSPVADIIFTVGNTKQEILQQYIEESAKVKEYLQNRGIQCRVSTLATSALTAQDSFAWKEFDHYNYNDSCVPKLEKRILYKDNSIIMMGYSHNSMKDFLYIEDADSSKKIFEFDLQKDGTNWHSMEGGGFLFNTIVSEEEEYIQGYCILVTQFGMRLSQINKTNLTKFRDGYYAGVSQTGKLLQTFPIQNLYDEHHLKIIVDKNMLTVYDGDELLINEYILPDDGVEAYGYGPITSHARHACSQQSYFTFKNIVMQTVKGESLSDVVNSYEWLPGTNHYVINLSETSVSELSDADRLSDTAAALIKNDVMFFGIGKDVAIEQYNLLVNALEGKGYSIQLNHAAESEGERVQIDTKDAIKNITDAIAGDVRAKDYTIGDTLSTDETVTYIGTYEDPDGDPEGKKEWTYVYDNSVFGENNEKEENRRTITAETPITRFEESGAYEISLRVSDDPTEGNTALFPFVKWSQTDSYTKLILSQHRPIANLTASVMQAKDEKNMCMVNVTYNAYDLDHPTHSKKGIQQEKFYYKEIHDVKWTEGKLPAKVPMGQTYLVKYVVTDLEGTVSRPAVCAVKTSEARTYQKPIDNLSPEITLNVSAKVVKIGEKIYIESSATDDYGVTEFEICINGKKIAETYGRFEYTPEEVSILEIVVRAVDIGENVTTKTEQVEVRDYTDYIPPVISITSPSSGTVAGKTDIVGSITDNKALKSYQVVVRNCEQEGEEPLVLTEGTEEVNNSLIASFDTQNLETGVYEIEIKAVDTSNLESSCTLVITVEEKGAYDCIPPEVLISDIVLMDTENAIEVIGSIRDDVQLEKYELVQYSVNKENGEKEKESVVVVGNSEIKEGVIGSVSASDMESGNYGFILTAWDHSGNSNSFEVSFKYEKGTQTEKADIQRKEDSEAPLIAVDVNANIKENGFGLLLKGTISDDNLKEYKVITGQVNKDNLLEQESCIAAGTENIIDGTIADYTYQEYNAGIYRIIITAEDTSGNIRRVERDITITEKNTIERGYEGEAQEDTISMILSSANAYVGKSIQAYVTYPSGSESITLTANGKEISLQGRTADVTWNQPGEVEIVFTAVIKGEEKQVTGSVYFLDEKDETSPEVCIEAPTAESSIKTKTQIIGTAKDETGLAYYTLEYCIEGTNEYIELNRSTQEIKNGVLGTIDPGVLENGRYLIRLTGVDNGGNRIRTVQPINIEGQLKTGNMYMSFDDISADVSGIPLTVTRSYDSRNKQCGDFGYGWKLGLQGVHIIEASDITKGYKLTKTGNLFSTSYCMTQTECHDITVTYGDGNSDRFRLKLSPEKQAIVPIYQTEITFECVTNSKIKLELAGENVALVQGDSLFLEEYSLENNHSYILTKEDGTKLYLDTEYGLRKVKDTNENIITVTSDGFKHSDGVGISFKRDEKGKIVYAEERNADNSIVTSMTYSYDKSDNLITVTDDADRTVTFTYDKNHNLTGIIDPTGIAVARNEYDETGRLVASIDAEGNRIEYTHDVNGRTETVRDRLGNVTVYTYDENGNVLQKVDALGNKTVNTYDKNNHLLSSKDPLGNTTSYEYDENNNLVKKIGADGLEANFSYQSNNLVTSISVLDVDKTRITYDRKYNVTSVKDAEGNITNYGYEKDGTLKSIADEIGVYKTYTYDKNKRVISQTDGNGNVTQYTYDEKGYLSSKTQIKKANGEIESVTTKYVNDAAGNIVQEISPEGAVTFYEYNANNQLTTTIDSNSQKTEYVYDSRGKLSKIQYADGTRETYEYDAEGNTTRITDRNGNSSLMVYDKLGRITELQSANGAKEIYEYDAVGNVIKSVSATGAVKRYEYDSLYRNTAVIDGLGNKTTYEYNQHSQITKITDAKGNVFQYEYDKNGNRTKIIYPDGTEYTTEYDARNQIISESDAYGNKTSNKYDGNGNLVQVTDALGGETKYQYDEIGNLIKVVDANGNATLYTYDGEGRILTVKNPLGSNSSYEYDVAGNITKYTDNAGNQTIYTYDGNQQIISETSKDGTITYQYENVDQLVSVEDSTGITKYKYDKNGRLLSKQMPQDMVLEYAYDECGRIKSKSLKISGIEKNKTAYEYDLLNRITRVIDRNGNVTVYEYDEIGNRSAVKYANGITLTYTYDACSRLIKECVSNKDNVLLCQYKYTYGKNGEKKTVQEIAEGKTITTEYVYDELNRLKKEIIADKTGSIINEYQYDKVGNRISRETNLKGDTKGLVSENTQESQLIQGKTTYNYNRCNQLTSETQEKKTIYYKYDLNGNLTQQQWDSGTISYQYDMKNQLTQILQKKNGSNVQVETYQYDYKGNRIVKNTDGEEIRYVIDESQSLAQIEAEVKTDEKNCTVYTIGLERISMEKESGLWYYTYDGHGDVCSLTDENGIITDTYGYEAYGTLLRRQGKTENSFLYTGEYLDEFSGLYYLRARYMNPGTGTFQSLDTYSGILDNPVTLHKYLYVQGNPVAYNDPTGHMASFILGAQMSARETAYNAAVIKIGLGILASLTQLVAMENAYNNTYYAMEIAIENVDWLMEAASATNEEIKAYVEARVADGTIARRKDRERYTVYTLGQELSDTDIEVRYVGRTVDYDERMKQHERRGGVIYKYGLVRKDRYDNLSYEVSRGLEQQLMVFYHTRLWLKENGVNKINGVGLHNKKAELYYSDTLSYLENQIDNELLSVREQMKYGNWWN